MVLPAGRGAGFELEEEAVGGGAAGAGAGRTEIAEAGMAFCGGGGILIVDFGAVVEAMVGADPAIAALDDAPTFVLDALRCVGIGGADVDGAGSWGT